MDNLESYCVVFADVLDIPLLAKIKKKNKPEVYGLALRIACVKSGQDPCWRLSGVHYSTGRRQSAITEPNSTTMKGTKIHANSLKLPFPVFRVSLSQLLLLLLRFPPQVSCATFAWAYSRLFACQVLLCFTVLLPRSERGCTRHQARGDHPAGEDFWPREQPAQAHPPGSRALDKAHATFWWSFASANTSVRWWRTRF